MITVRVKVESKYDNFEYNIRFKEHKYFNSFVEETNMTLENFKFVSFIDGKDFRTIKSEDIKRIFYEVLS